jgi:hypothetical protein
MTDSHTNSAAGSENEKREASTPQPSAPAHGKKKKRANMHDGLGVWCDCCSCEAEPRWVEVAEEMGIDLSDYEDEAAPPPGK